MLVIMITAIGSFSYLKCMEYKENESQFGLSFICTLSSIWSHFGKNDPDSKLGTTWNEGVTKVEEGLQNLVNKFTDSETEKKTDLKTKNEPKSEKIAADSSQQK